MLQTRSSDENFVRPSHRTHWSSSLLSVKRVDCDKTEERSVQILIPYTRSFSLVLSEEDKWLVGATPSTWHFGSTGFRWSEIADFEPIFAPSASAVTPIEKSSINTNRKFTTRFPMSLRWSSYVAPISPQEGGLQNAKRLFPSKIALRLKKVSLCENSQRQSYKAFIGLTIRAKNDWWGRHLLPEILDEDRVGAKSPIFDLFSLVATHP